MEALLVFSVGFWDDLSLAVLVAAGLGLAVFVLGPACWAIGGASGYISIREMRSSVQGYKPCPISASC